MTRSPLSTGRLDIAFRLRDRDGTVRVEITPNRDPVDLGHPLVAVGYDTEKFVGFPVVTASVEYGGRGPRAWMGWLQVVERHDDDGTVVSSVDVPPFHEDYPLYCFGYLPTFSDFPANPDHPDGDWVADAFLVAVPDVVRSRRLAPVAAFRWGYRLVDGRCAALFEPVRLELSAWEHHRALMEAEFPGWDFLAPAP